MAYGKPKASSVHLPPTEDGQTITLQQVVDASWTPLSISGLQIFVDSAYGHTADEGEPISSITERSAWGRILTQPTPAYQPTLSTINEGIGNVRVLKVTSENQFLSLNVLDNSLGIGQNGITVVSVLKTSAAGNNDGRGIAGLWNSSGTWAFLARAPYQLSELENYGIISLRKADLSFSQTNIGRIADGKWHVLAQVIDRDDQIAHIAQDGAGFSSSGIASLADSEPGEFNIFRYHNSSGSGIGDCLLRFLFVINRKLSYDELSQLTSWINKEIGRTGDQKHTKILLDDKQDIIYIRSDGNDTNIGTSNTSSTAIQTIAQMCQRFDDTPYIPTSSASPVYEIGDGTFVTRKIVNIGPGIFEAPMFNNLHATLINGTVAELETRTITSIDYVGGADGITKFTVDGAAFTNDELVNKHIRLNGSDFNRLIVCKNVGNTLECVAHRANNYISVNDTITFIDFQTEIRFPPTRYHAIMNCWELHFFNCKISVIESHTDGGQINISGGSFVWFVNCWIDNVGITVRNSKALLRRTSFLPNFGGFSSGFWPIARQFGRITIDGSFVWAKYASQYRFEIQDSCHIKLIGINAMRGIQGIRLSCASMTGAFSDSSLTLYDTQYGMWFTLSSFGSAPPLIRNNIIVDSGYGNWDFRCVLNSRITIPDFGGASLYTATVDLDLSDSVSGTVSVDGSLITCADITKLPSSAIDWTPLVLTNGWAIDATLNSDIPSYKKDSSNRCSLRGAIRLGPIGVNICQLPSGVRPISDLQFSVKSTYGYTNLTIYSTGYVVATNGDGGTIILDSVSWSLGLEPSWSPENLSPSLYLESDYGVTVDGSGRVSAWESKTQGRIAVQNTEGNRPFYLSDGQFQAVHMPYDTFRYLTVPKNNLLACANGATVYTLIKSDAFSSDYAIWGLWGPTVNSAIWTQLLNPGGNTSAIIAYVNELFSDANKTSIANATAVNSAKNIVVTRFDGTNISCSINSTHSTPTSTSGGKMPLNATYDFTIGRYAPAISNGAGSANFYLIVVIPTYIPPGSREDLNMYSYIQNKYGI